MTATDELRRLLDERGVEYLDSEDDTTIYYANSGYRYTYNVNPESGWAQLFGYHLTPEQVITATLGTPERTCEYCKDGKFDGQVVMISNHGWQRINYCPNCGARVERREQ